MFVAHTHHLGHHHHAHMQRTGGFSAVVRDVIEVARWADF